MLNQKKILVSFILLAMSAGPCFAARTIIFGPHESRIVGLINYTLIGRYVPYFTGFQGKITMDQGQVQSVYLSIDTASIKSKHPRLDRLVRSRRLLDAARYPRIIFKSRAIILDAGGYKVRGFLEMHGVKMEMVFPFKVENKGQWLEITGNWSINRKKFNIIWNKYLDKGGILVSDNFIVDWSVKILTK